MQNALWSLYGVVSTHFIWRRYASKPSDSGVKEIPLFIFLILTQLYPELSNFEVGKKKIISVNTELPHP